MGLVRRWGQWCRFLNLYGPTEATVSATATELRASDERVHIGKPMSNYQCYIVDEQTLQPCPVGVPGELLIGGVGVARGYLKRPELTAEKFIANPFGEGRVYRTGDLASWLADGNINFMGRISQQQVKLRGFRIELGEIEAVLERAEGVRAAAAAVKKGPAGQDVLVGYVVGSGSEAALDTAALRAKIASELPQFMVPAVVMQLETLPLTVNCKLDRGALPAPEHVAQTAQVVAAKNEVEEQLWSIVSEVLNYSGPVNMDADLFELGGNSLLAGRAAARIRVEMKVPSLVTTQLYNTKLCDLATYIAEHSLLPDQSMNSKGPRQTEIPMNGLDVSVDKANQQPRRSWTNPLCFCLQTVGVILSPLFGELSVVIAFLLLAYIYSETNEWITIILIPPLFVLYGLTTM